MVPAWMVPPPPPPPLAPHNKLPALRKGGRRRGSGQRGKGGRAGAAASALLPPSTRSSHKLGAAGCPRRGCVSACASASVSGRDRGRCCHPVCSWGPAAPRVRPRLTGARGGRWLAGAPPSPPIPGACPNFLIQGTCRRSSCALPTVITVPSRQPPTVNAAVAAVSTDATTEAVATAFPLAGLTAPGGLAASRGNRHLSSTLFCAPKTGWHYEADPELGAMWEEDWIGYQSESSLGFFQMTPPVRHLVSGGIHGFLLASLHFPSAFDLGNVTRMMAAFSVVEMIDTSQKQRLIGHPLPRGDVFPEKTFEYDKSCPRRGRKKGWYFWVMRKDSRCPGSTRRALTRCQSNSDQTRSG
ncbi:uncharacterized protein LOC105079183 [Camelus bactrianus]|uniref:Uncharacterized protein LOC105079183 n=1 Tax=Camelus bactrianus TaxID=9837 RepID=A0AC58Q714_CAMBA